MKNKLIDLARYPLHRQDGEAYKQLVSLVSSQLEEDGCAVLSGFIRSEQICKLVAETDAVVDQGHWSCCETNAYFSTDDTSLPLTHPIRRFYERSNAFIPADNFGDESLLRQIFVWPAFRDFIQAVLGRGNIFPYADPLADVIVNTAKAGEGFPWHFDTNNFTITLALQNAEQGGEFQYCPGLRTPTDENYSGVEAVQDGDHTQVKSLVLIPGDLQIFKGRYSLHRVTPLQGDRLRHVAIFSFVEEPGMVGSPERTRQLYGKVLPIHWQQAGVRGDTLKD